MTDEKKEPEAPKTEAKTVTLRVAHPAFCTSFTFPQGKDDTLVVTREGTEVPAKDAKSLTETAAKHGVTLTEVSN